MSRLWESMMSRIFCVNGIFPSLLKYSYGRMRFGDFLLFAREVRRSDELVFSFFQFLMVAFDIPYISSENSIISSKLQFRTVAIFARLSKVIGSFFCILDSVCALIFAIRLISELVIFLSVNRFHRRS